ncbi:MAG: hypothetical protein HY461_01555 [Parcubacteria group bacterium]|nr:hypothetical protein [Parcubacteria group bacterium]
MPLTKTTTKTKRKAPVHKTNKGTGIKRVAAKRAPSLPVKTMKLPTTSVHSILDLDELILPSVRVDSLSVPDQGASEPLTSVPIRSRLSFYMGAFFGAIVVQVLIVVLLAVGSA